MVVKKEREYWIEVLRAFACLMVLFCHSPQPFSEYIGGSFIVGVVNYFGMGLGPYLFFMISGACIMSHPVEAAPFLKRRLGRVLLPTFFWSLIYIFFEDCIWHTAQAGSLVERALLVLFGPQYGIMWFMYALISIYLVTPIISHWLYCCSKKEVQIYLGLWSIVLIIPFASIFFEEVAIIKDPNNILYYFSGFLWLAVLGSYCRRYVKFEKFNWLNIFLISLALVSPLFTFVIQLCGGAKVSTCYTLNCIFVTLLVFVMVSSIKWKKQSNVILLFSKLSFGIYLTHMLFMYPFNQWISQFHINYVIQVPISVTCVGVLSFIFTWLLNKLPFSKYILG